MSKIIKPNLGKNQEEWSLFVKKLKERPNAPGKMLSLFPEDEILESYRYSAYFTNLEFAPAEIWRMYRGRGDAENRPER